MSGSCQVVPGCTRGALDLHGYLTASLRGQTQRASRQRGTTVCCWSTARTCTQYVCRTHPRRLSALDIATGHRRHQSVHSPPGGDRVRHRERARRIRWASGARHRSRRLGARAPRSRTRERALLRAVPPDGGPLPARRRVVVRRARSVHARGCPATRRRARARGATVSQQAALAPSRPVHGAGRRVGERAADDRGGGSARAADHVRRGCQRRAPALGDRHGPRRRGRQPRLARCARERGGAIPSRHRPQAGQRHDVDLRTLQRDARRDERTDVRRSDRNPRSVARRLRHALPHARGFSAGCATRSPLRRQLRHRRAVVILRRAAARARRARPRPLHDRRPGPRLRSERRQSRDRPIQRRCCPPCANSPASSPRCRGR